MSASRKLFAIAVLVGVAALVASAGAATAPPANTSPPQVSGTPRQGATFTAYPGTWTNSPTSYSYSWIRCDANANNCTAIGIHRRQYTLTDNDVGYRFKVSVTASNNRGKATATSSPAPAVAPSGSTPNNVVKPSISGDPRDGAVLTASPGTWTGTQPITYAFQWNRCDQTGAACGAIAGATAATYAVNASDVGHTLRVHVAARNAKGNAGADSNPSALVAPAKAGGAAVSVNTISLPDRLVVDNVKFSPNPIRTRGAVVARFHVSDVRGFAIQGALVYALGLPYGWVRNGPEVATDSSGWATVTLQPTATMPLRNGALVVFVRARKPGENLLTGVSTRRLVQASIR
jgi:Ig domain of plant-specific actin-binding protein